MYDVIVIGRGPAGISGAIYTVRGNLKTLIVGKTDSTLLKADKIENYYGFEQPLSGRELLTAGEKQALRLGAEIVTDEVISIEKEEHFKVTCVNQTFEARCILLAPGAPVVKAPVKGIQDYEGRGISYCTTCDGFFYRNKKVGVLGYTDFAVHEASELLPFTKDITLFTNGTALQLSETMKGKLDAFKIDNRKIKRIYGDDIIEGVEREDGTTEPLNGMFIAYGTASAVSFAMKMGIAMNGQSIIVNEKMETNIEGLFAAGDCTGVFKQVSIAVGQGALASKGMIEYVRKNKIKS